MVILAVCNQKGGVGKSTVALHLARALSQDDNPVLFVDLDPQGTATAILDAEPAEDGASLHAVLSGSASLAEVIVPAKSWGVDVAPAALAMARLEQDLRVGGEFRLAEALGSVSPAYRYVLVDCPPSLGRLALAGMVAATAALIVTEPSGPALRGVGDLTDTITVIQRRYAPALRLAGVIVNRVTATREAAVRLEELQTAFGRDLWEPYVPQRAAVAEALGAHVPVGDLHRDGAAEVANVFATLAVKLEALDLSTKRRRSR